MSKRAKEAAIKAYPIGTRDNDGIVNDIGHPQWIRDYFIEGYDQAVKDTIQMIRNEINRRIKEKDSVIESQPDSIRAERNAWKWAEDRSLLKFLDELEKE